ncbi:hypothetical protein A0H81_08804 [Grifola frondosa]|uniref:Uncharacterized protein n=1 Tax=Grifola frondosa TaxID=5627 RepID=A0A1C7M2K3_GRIFR|nr:hypothetical protein A0H81_08804 [Grifola frondosa]
MATGRPSHLSDSASGPAISTRPASFISIISGVLTSNVSPWLFGSRPTLSALVPTPSHAPLPHSQAILSHIDSPSPLSSPFPVSRISCATAIITLYSCLPHHASQRVNLSAPLLPRFRWTATGNTSDLLPINTSIANTGCHIPPPEMALFRLNGSLSLVDASYSPAVMFSRVRCSAFALL